MQSRTTAVNALVLAAVSAATVLAIGQESVARRFPAGLPLVDVVANEFFFRAPDTIPAGPVRFRLTNQGHQVHHLQIVRLLDDRTIGELARAMKGDDLVIPEVELIGGPAVPPLGGSSEAVVELEPGRYALLCLINAGDRIRHLSKGMIRELIVEGPARDASLPAPSMDLVLDDYSFTFSRPLMQGRVTLRVVNRGDQPHEVTMWRLVDGATEQQARDWLAHPKGPPPAEPLGGTSLIAPGRESLVPLNVPSGTLVLICFMPDPVDHRSHAKHGMIDFVTVRQEWKANRLMSSVPER